jgi:hypothetical protein
MLIEKIAPTWDHKLHQNLIQRLIFQQGTAAFLYRKPEFTATSCEECSVQNSDTKKGSAFTVSPYTAQNSEYQNRTTLSF